MYLGLTIKFLSEFAVGLWLTAPLLLFLAGTITLIGQFVGKKEGWSRFDSFYWSFVTATTVGYGDIRPTHRASRLLAILTALLGLLFTGILIAIAVNAGTEAIRMHRVAHGPLAHSLDGLHPGTSRRPLPD